MIAYHKGKKLKTVAIAFVCIFAVLSAIVIGFMVSAAEIYYINKAYNVRFQREHLEYLKNTFYKDYTPKGEQAFCGFDLQDALDRGVKYNDVAFLATHNSCQRMNSEESVNYLKALDVFTFGIASAGIFDKKDFENDTLTQQFEHGIRSVELDVEAQVKGDEISFKVMHDLVVDSASTCLDLEGALEEIALWSDHNPDHLPITLLIESKIYVIPTDGLQIFGMRHAEQFDFLLRKCLGDKLLTPADMLGEFETFKQLRDADGWKSLNQMLGKVVVVLHESGFAKKYIKQDSTLRSQAMFPSVLFKDRDIEQAAFIIENKPSKAFERADYYKNANFMVRTRADKYPRFSEEQYAQVNGCFSQIITTDYGPRSLRLDQHTYSFGGYTVKLIG